jgi:murein DD-endopeptidase MepM/ murein hydrolase activator NlpD
VGPYAPPVLVSNEHTEHDGTRTRYDLVPLAPDRPTAYEAYVYPVPPADPVVTSGFDLHLPDARQRRGNPKNPVGHGGLDLTRRIGVPVTSVPFESQVGPTRVVFTGMLFGRTIATLHERTDGRYVALHGHLSEIAPGVTPGATVEPGALLGAVGDSWTPGVPHLHYEVRYIRSGVDPWTLEGTALWDNTRSVPCDPRNVLPRLR